MSTTWGDVVTNALFEIRYARAGDVLAPEDMAFGLQVANRLLDAWNADRMQSWNTQQADFTLTPGHTPHTIGPAADFVVTKRPVAIDDAQLNIGNNVFMPLDLIDQSDYAGISVPALTSTLCTALYYSPDYVPEVEQGSCYFWPICTQALTVRLWLRYIIAGVLETTVFSQPQGYERAFTLTLAEELAAPFGQTLSGMTSRNAQMARAKIRTNNEDITRLRSDGPKGQRPTISNFNWRSRTFNNY